MVNEIMQATDLLARDTTPVGASPEDVARRTALQAIVNAAVLEGACACASPCDAPEITVIT
jgi:hypothetical protein